MINKAGQGAIEYILLATAVIIVLLTFLNPSGPFRYVVEKQLNDSVDQIGHMVNDLPISP